MLQDFFNEVPAFLKTIHIFRSGRRYYPSLAEWGFILTETFYFYILKLVKENFAGSLTLLCLQLQSNIFKIESSLPRSRFWGRHVKLLCATLQCGGALRDDPKIGCEGDYIVLYWNPECLGLNFLLKNPT